MTQQAMLESQFKHESVLLNEAVSALNLKEDGVYVDGTFGRGGHSKKILEGLADSAQLFVIDKDPSAIAVAESLRDSDARVEVLHGSFAEMRNILEGKELLGKVDGVLLDLGLSSPQLDEGERGFSFMRNGPLDMRMNTSEGQSAKDWIAEVGEAELADVIKKYGEERFAKRIARAIVTEREERAIEDTHHLAELVSQAIPKWEKHKHPATRTFQAIRIYVNQELDDLNEVLDGILDVLASGGRLVVISFHSLEDRIVKTWVKRMEKGDDIPSYIPVTHNELNQKVKVIGKAVKAGQEELEKNPRARSAVMRIAEKL